jgi:hypothetical protein
MRKALVALGLLLLPALAQAELGGVITFPEGNGGEVQFEKDGYFAGSSSFTFSSSTYRLTVPSILVTSIVFTTDGSTQTTASSGSSGGTGGWTDSSGSTQTTTTGRRVGIGTLTPAYILDLLSNKVGSLNVTDYIRLASTRTDEGIGFIFSATAPWSYTPTSQTGATADLTCTMYGVSFSATPQIFSCDGNPGVLAYQWFNGAIYVQNPVAASAGTRGEVGINNTIPLGQLDIRSHTRTAATDYILNITSQAKSVPLFRILGNGQFVMNRTTYSWPNGGEAAGEVLTTDGSGGLTWGPVTSTITGSGGSISGFVYTGGISTTAFAVSIGTDVAIAGTNVVVSTPGTTSVIRLVTGNTGHTASDGFVTQLSASSVDHWMYESRAQRWATSNIERMRIDSSGLVGIGATAPAYRLEVATGVIYNSGSTAGITTTGTVTANAFVGSGGGITNLTPGNMLAGTLPATVIASSAGINTITNPNVASGAGINLSKLSLSDNVAWTGIHSWSSSATFSGPNFSVGTSTLVTLNGNVGVGDTTPDAANGLEIKSNTTGSNFVLAVTSQSDVLGMMFGIRADGQMVVNTATMTWPSSNASGALTNNGSGTLSWSASGGSADNLGNHTATTTLNMGGFAIVNSSGLALVGAGDGVINSTNAIQIQTGVTATTITFSTSGISLTQVNTPAAPPTGFGQLYASSDTHLHYRVPGGTDYAITPPGGGSVTSIAGGVVPYIWSEINASSAIYVSSTSLSRITALTSPMQLLSFTTGDFQPTYNATTPYIFAANASMAYTFPGGASFTDIRWAIDGTTVSRNMVGLTDYSALLHVSTNQVVSLYAQATATGPATLSAGHMRLFGVAASTWTRTYASSAVADLLVTTDTVAFWRFDEGTGTTAADSTGTYTGTLTNGVTWVTSGCKRGNCVRFNDAVSQYIALANDSAGIIGNMTAWTFSGWFKSTTTNTSTLYGEGNTGTTNQLIKVAVSENAAGDGSYQYRDDSVVSGSTVTIALSLNDGNWHHVCAIQSSKSSRTLYIDGTQRATQTTAIGTLSLNTANIGVFERTSKTNYMLGDLDEFRIYKRALTSTECNTLYSNGQ